MRKRTLVIIIIAALIVLSAGGFMYYRSALGPVDPQGEPRVVEIPSGAGDAQIARSLQSEGVIRDARAFRLMLMASGLAGKLKAGVYELSPAMSAHAVAAKLASGEVASWRVTIPEGFRLDQIADRVAEAGHVDPAAFVAVKGSALAGEMDMPLPSDSLEGYLFPETYKFRFGDAPEAIAKRMVSELGERFYAPNRAAVAARGLSLHQLVTLASLVEREARVPGERPLIAGVIQNRINRGMRLQIDATVQYALPEHKERLTFADLKVRSPYNTYLHAGLPPGPIASPGLASLEAALRPARTDALFYVARPDGTHVFTRTYAEHLQAIRRIRGQ